MTTTIADRRTAGAATGGVLLQLTRAGYGTALIVAPGPVICLATGRSASRGECRVARLLGARHLVQAAVTALAPLPGVFATGAAVDAVHAASMLLFATASRASRRACLTDALAEGLFARSTWRTARSSWSEHPSYSSLSRELPAPGSAYMRAAHA